MKIIRPGVIPIVDKSIPWWRWIVFKCDYCKCHFQAEASDPEPSFGKHYAIYDCPTCRFQVLARIPSRIRKIWLKNRNLQ